MFILKLHAAAAAIVSHSAAPTSRSAGVVQVVPSAALLNWPHRIGYGAGSTTFKPVETGFTFAPFAA